MLSNDLIKEALDLLHGCHGDYFNRYLIDVDQKKTEIPPLHYE